MWRSLTYLLDEERKELWEILVGFLLNLVFLALTALLLWPLERAMLALRLLKGYALLWVIVFLVGGIANRVQRFFRVDIYSHPDAYVISNISVSGFLVIGWSAFAALVVHSFLLAGTPVWVASILYVVGLLSSFVALMVVTSFYQGHIYKLFNLPVALVGFIIFAVWPATGRVSYGWFFNLF
jgi:hypothetical protein